MPTRKRSQIRRAETDALSPWHANEARPYAVVAAALAGVLYTLTAARDIVVGDTAELAAAALTLGVAHAPGYPLLTIIGHAFSWLPVGPDWSVDRGG